MAKPYGRIKAQENEDGKKMLGSGCQTCPVIACATTTYRGSACASQRASFGLGDPMTNADYIHSMSDEELATEFIWIQQDAYTLGDKMKNIDDVKYPLSKEEWLKWLKQPKEEAK